MFMGDEVTRHFGILVGLVLAVVIVAYVAHLSSTEPRRTLRSVVTETRDGVIYLPYPRRMTNMSVEEAILLRRSIRDYSENPVLLEHLSMILWVAYGVTEPKLGFRSVPSAGATYPLEIYVVIGANSVSVDETRYLRAGIYKYDPHKHALVFSKEGDFRKALSEAALGQKWVEKAPVNIVVCAVFERTTGIYGERGRVRYVPMEVGHLGQNIYLMSTALGYGAVVVGAFYDDRVQNIVGAREDEVPMYIIPMGIPREVHRVTFEDIWSYYEVRRSD